MGFPKESLWEKPRFNESLTYPSLKPGVGHYFTIQGFSPKHELFRIEITIYFSYDYCKGLQIRIAILGLLQQNRCK